MQFCNNEIIASSCIYSKNSNNHTYYIYRSFTFIYVICKLAIHPNKVNIKICYTKYNKNLATKENTTGNYMISLL